MKWFFGDNAPLANLGLHQGVQDNFITALALVGLERMSTRSPEALQTFLGENYDTETRKFQFESRVDLLAFLGVAENNSLQNFFAFAGRRESVGIGSMQVPQLHISDNGETNSIFMNIDEGRDFIKQILDGNMSEGQIESYIEERNDQENIDSNDIGAIREELIQSVGVLGPVLQDLFRNHGVRTNTDQTAPAGNPETIGDTGERNWMEKILIFIKEFFAGIRSLGEELGVGQRQEEGLHLENGGDTAENSETLNVNPANVVIDPRTSEQIAALGIKNTSSPSYKEIGQLLLQFETTPATVETVHQQNYAVQVALTELQYSLGNIDEIVGDQTQAALRAFQQSQDIEATGEIAPATLTALRIQLEARRVEEAEATSTD